MVKSLLQPLVRKPKTFLQRILIREPWLERALLEFDNSWSKLPAISLKALFCNFDYEEVKLTVLPKGAWSSPIADVIVLAKIALCHSAKQVLEVGSFRGYTTAVLAANTPPDACIVAFDCDVRHGEAYRDSPLAAKIERRIGGVSAEAFANDSLGRFDLIFLDADHAYPSVKHDTQVLMPFLSPHGFFVWHDYGNWGRLSGLNGVPKFLHELAATKKIAAIPGSTLAIYSPVWECTEGAERFTAALASASSEIRKDVWSTAA